MEHIAPAINPTAESLLQQHGGPLLLGGQAGSYVAMTSDVYSAMLGLPKTEAAESLAAVRRGLADASAGRVQTLDEAFDEIDAQ